MIQITANNGAVFGPHTTIEKLEDRYECDGVIHLPFAVIGDNCVIGEYVPQPELQPEPQPEQQQE